MSDETVKVRTAEMQFPELPVTLTVKIPNIPSIDMTEAIRALVQEEMTKHLQQWHTVEGVMEQHTHTQLELGLADE